MRKQFYGIGGAIKLTIIAGLCMGMASGQDIELMPGQWVVSHKLSSPSSGRAQTEQSEFCLTEATSRVTFDQIMSELNWAQCRARNVIVTQRTGRADITCTYPEEGNITLNGVMEATYSKTNYRIESRMLPPSDAVYVGVGRRTGPC